MLSEWIDRTFAYQVLMIWFLSIGKKKYNFYAKVVNKTLFFF